MSFFCVLIALLIEQARPLSQNNPVHVALRRTAYWAAHNFDTGQRPHAALAWGMAVVLPALLTAGVFWGLSVWLSWGVALSWNVVVLYVTLGFRQFSHHFTGLRDALDAGDDALARQRLAQWQRVDAAALPQSEIVRHVIEYSVLAAHRHVFGVFFWFVLLAALGMGPAGAVFYRMAEYTARRWNLSAQSNKAMPSEALSRVAARCWRFIDWIPARISAFGFAVVGNFEDAIDGWRQYAQRFGNDNDGVILAATAGALQVRLGGAALAPQAATEVNTGFAALDGSAPAAGPATPGREPEPAHLRSVVGLVWRSVVLWMTLLALLSLAHLLG